jgi:hypothetical protein
MQGEDRATIKIQYILHNNMNNLGQTRLVCLADQNTGLSYSVINNTINDAYPRYLYPEYASKVLHVGGH